MSALDLILKRRSVLAKELQEPGPDQVQLQSLLNAAHRVPDHGKLGPWKFIVFQGSARLKFGITLARIYQKNNPDAQQGVLSFQQQLFMRAPLIIAVISCPEYDHKVPVWEQELSAGAACQNLLMAATAMGFGAQWITEWYSYDDDVSNAMGLNGKERIAGFIYIGRYESAPKERVRPDLCERVSYWV